MSGVIFSIIFYIGGILLVYDNFKMERYIFSICCTIMYTLIAFDDKLNVSWQLYIPMFIYIIFSALLRHIIKRKEVDYEKKDNNISTISGDDQ